MTLEDELEEAALEEMQDLPPEEREEMEGTCLGCDGPAEEGMFCDRCSQNLEDLEAALEEVFDNEVVWEVIEPEEEGEEP